MAMQMSKSTMVELVQELELLLSRTLSDSKRVPALKEMIAEAKAGEYHDFKNTKYPCGKVAVVTKLLECGFKDLAARVVQGEFDEQPDAEDKAMIADILAEMIAPQTKVMAFRFRTASAQLTEGEDKGKWVTEVTAWSPDGAEQLKNFGAYGPFDTRDEAKVHGQHLVKIAAEQIAKLTGAQLPDVFADHKDGGKEKPWPMEQGHPIQ